MTHHTTITSDYRYPYKPVCECGWEGWGYVARFVAEEVATEHEETHRHAETS